MRSCLSALCFVFLTASIGLAQSRFQNLDFETFVPPGPDFQAFDLVEFPGWGELPTAPHIGNSPLKYISNLGINPLFGQAHQVLAGDNSLVLAAGEVGFRDPELNFFSASSISQTGLIPNGTRSIRLLASSRFGFDYYYEVFRFQDPLWTVLIGDVELDIIELEGGTSGVYGANIDRALVGTEQTLTIRVNSGFSFEEAASFDNIEFSTIAVPEPSVLGIVSLTMLGVGLRRRREH